MDSYDFVAGANADDTFHFALERFDSPRHSSRVDFSLQGALRK